MLNGKENRPGGGPMAAPARATTIAGFEVEVVRKRVKRLSLRVYPPDGRVRLTAPTTARASDLERLVHDRADWIRRHQERMRALRPAGEAAFETGELHYVRGRPHALERVAAASRCLASLDGGRLVLHAPAAASREDLEGAFDALHRRVIQQDLAPLLAAWQPRVGRSAASVRIRRMSTRWGSCNPRAARVWLNVELARRRPELLQYVLVHELAHLVVPDHGPRFKAAMTELVPNWRELDAELAAWPIWARLPAS